MQFKLPWSATLASKLDMKKMSRDLALQPLLLFSSLLDVKKKLSRDLALHTSPSHFSAGNIERLGMSLGTSQPTYVCMYVTL